MSASASHRRPAASTHHIIDQAIDDLAPLHGIDRDHLDDPALRLALLLELIRQADGRLLHAINAARDHGHSWNHIRHVMGLDP